MACPICDQKPMNCDCTETERRQFAEIAELEEQVASLRFTDEEREALHWFAHYGLPEHRAAALRSLLERLV
jgi:hypothetical protein